MYGAMLRSDSAARGEQGKAARSDIDGNDANRRFIAAIEIGHAWSDAATHDAAPRFRAGAALFRAERGIDEGVTAEGGDCVGDNQAEEASAAGAA